MTDVTKEWLLEQGFEDDDWMDDESDCYSKGHIYVRLSKSDAYDNNFGGCYYFGVTTKKKI